MSFDSELAGYFRSLATTAAHGGAREESFYSVLSGLLQKFASATGRNEIRESTLPKAKEIQEEIDTLYAGVEEAVVKMGDERR